MKKFTLYDRKAILSNPASLHGYFGWPTVARLKNGDLAAVASGFRVEHVCPFGKTVLARSKNEGKTWSLPTPIIDTPLDDRDGGILAFGESSLLVTSFNNCPEYQKYYMDICRRNRWLSENLRAYCDAMSNFVFRDGRAEDFLGRHLSGEPRQRHHLERNLQVPRHLPPRPYAPRRQDPLGGHHHE